MKHSHLCDEDSCVCHLLDKGDDMTEYQSTRLIFQNEQLKAQLKQSQEDLQRLRAEVRKAVIEISSDGGHEDGMKRLYAISSAEPDLHRKMVRDLEKQEEREMQAI